jgi:ubiquinone/menaquinone biosynthesis C-methylase UbiE
MAGEREMESRGLGLPEGCDLENDPSSGVHEQLARLRFAGSKVSMEGKRVLDVGCGRGSSAYYVAQRHGPRQVMGLDIDEGCVAYCREHYASATTEFAVQDCLEHNPRFGLFDVVIATEILEHISEQSRFVEVLSRYLEPQGVAFVTTPNRAVFSLTKERSFLNRTHVKELFFDEFRELLSSRFSTCAFYSQIHEGNWHSAFIDSLCARNLMYAFRHDVFANRFVGRIASTLAKYLAFVPLYVLGSKDYPDVRKRRYTDFQFVEGSDSRAVWFVAVCSNSA